MINKQLSFLDANSILKQSLTKDLQKKNLRLLSSCQLSQLNIYLKALYANIGYKLEIEELNFGTLRQFLLEKLCNDDQETILILMPWDFVESLNWRTGIPYEIENIEIYKNEISAFYNLCKELKINNIKCIYLDFEYPNLLPTNYENKIISRQLEDVVESLSCKVINNEFFCLSNFTSNGCPFKNKEIGKVAFIIFEHIFNRTNPKKLIVLDLDNTLWDGVLGEVGPLSVKASPNDKSFLFFIFQSFLKNIKNRGILLAVVSKNDLDLIEQAFKLNNFVLNLEDFVKIIGTYQPKSIQIKNILKSINLTNDACLFIDDNELEIQEVMNFSQDITCVKFPESIKYLPAFLEKIMKFFDFSNITFEDKNRTKFYKSQIDAIQVLEGNHSFIDDYLKSLKQILNIKKGDANNIDRAVQLINKTNQFNLNGIRRSKEEIIDMLNNDHDIFIGELIDKNGSQGEIIVILLEKTGTISSFVMSCRVFQRKLELAILYALNQLGYHELKFKYILTKRNHPFLKFAEQVADLNQKDNFMFNFSKIKSQLIDINELFEINIK